MMIGEREREMEGRNKYIYINVTFFFPHWLIK